MKTWKILPDDSVSIPEATMQAAKERGRRMQEALQGPPHLVSSYLMRKPRLDTYLEEATMHPE